MREALVRLNETIGHEELFDIARAAAIREFDELACHGDCRRTRPTPPRNWSAPATPRSTTAAPPCRWSGSRPPSRAPSASTKSNGASPELPRLGGYGGGERPLAELTDRQREVVESAYETGYYEVPREATATEVAAELDLDSSTVVEHLQRAERNLMTHHLEGA